jgi:Recombinase
MDLIAADWNAVEMPLSINYRCSKAVVRNAQIMVPEIEAWDKAPEGSVAAIDGDFPLADFQQTDAIICRMNAPNISLAHRLRSRRVFLLVTAGHRVKFEGGAANGHPSLGTKMVYRRGDGTFADGPERHTKAIRALDEERLPVLIALFRKYVELGSYRKTAAWLNAQGYRTQRDRPFVTSSIKEIVSNPCYGPEEVTYYHKGLKDAQERKTPKEAQLFPDEVHELWLRAQDRRQARHSTHAPNRGRVYPLHSVLRCVDCGSVYHGQPEKDHRYSVHVSKGLVCSRPSRVRSDKVVQTSPELPSQMRAVSVAEWKHQSVPLSSSGAYTRRILLGDGLQELFEHIRRVMTVPDTMAHGPYDVTFTCS